MTRVLAQGMLPAAPVSTLKHRTSVDSGVELKDEVLPQWVPLQERSTQLVLVREERPREASLYTMLKRMIKRRISGSIYPQRQSSGSMRRNRRDVRGNWRLRSNFVCGRIPLFFLLLVVLVLSSLSLLLLLHRQPAFDPNAGARGSTPALPQSIPLPVLNVLSRSHTIYFGASIDWTIDDPQSFNNDVDLSPAIHESQFFLNASQIVLTASVNSSGTIHTTDNILQWTASLVRGTGAIMAISVVPLTPLSQVSQAALLDLSTRLAEINSMGIPILLKFAPNMNANNLIYGMDPVSFKSTFRSLASFIRNTTNDTALVWSPASPLQYPFLNGPFLPPQNSQQFADLDTNNDGILSILDDPFLPYYPGDDVVDWVALSVFYTHNNSSLSFYPLPSNTQPFDSIFFNTTLFSQQLPSSQPSSSSISLRASSGSSSEDSSGSSSWKSPKNSFYFVQDVPIYNNSLPPPPSKSPSQDSITSFESQIHGSNSGFDFYQLYAVKRNKPMMISETSAAYYPSSPIQIPSDPEIKQTWTRQIFNTTFLKSVPFIRAIVLYNKQIQFNETSLYYTSPNPSSQTADFSYTNDPSIASQLHNDLMPLMFTISNTSNTTQSSFPQSPTNVTGILIFANTNATIINGTWTIMPPSSSPSPSTSIISSSTTPSTASTISSTSSISSISSISSSATSVIATAKVTMTSTMG